MVDGPIQLVLNPDRFRDQRVAIKGGGPGKDFYLDDNARFAEHRTRMLEAIDALVGMPSAGAYLNVLVKMRPDALAKSHRPFASLFRSRLASHVGTEDFGELIFSVSMENLRTIRALVASAETDVEWRPDAQGTLFYSPSGPRSELGAIESISVWDASRHRGYSLDDAESWLSSGGVGGGLAIELLDLPRSRELERLYVEQLPAVVGGIRNSPIAVRARVPERLRRNIDVTGLESQISSGTRDALTRDQSVVVRSVIGRFEASGLVKKVRLQDQIPLDPDYVFSSEVAPEPVPELSVDGRQKGIVGIIDGGIKGPFSGLLVGGSDYIADGHHQMQSVNHAAMVAGLVTLGSAFNSDFLSASEDCLVYDLPMFPAPQFLDDYYRDLDGFLDQLRADVQRAKDAFGVRVFNLSWNLRAAPGAGGYGTAAQALDEIALDLDVIFVVSAGNLQDADLRPEWPPSGSDAIAILARGGAPDGLSSPSESLVNIAVGAVNPPGLSVEIEGAPTRYSRRSGRVPSAIKPDLAAVGGSAPLSNSMSTGLISMDAFGNRVDVRGTSFAAPLVARYLATLDAAITGTVSREALIALAVHHAEIPPILRKSEVREVARSFVGYGVPISVAETLDGDEHCMTILLNDTIQPGKRVDFPFTWPASLTGDGGKSRGRVRLTLVARPQLNSAHGSERVRINLDASLKQADAVGHFDRRSKPTHEFFSGFTYANEKTLASELGKWFPIKSYGVDMPRGRGVSSDWKLEINYLTRGGEGMPESGLEFALVMSIDDPKNEARVFDDMRLSLLRTGAILSDLRTAVDVRAGV